MDVSLYQTGGSCEHRQSYQLQFIKTEAGCSAPSSSLCQTQFLSFSSLGSVKNHGPQSMEFLSLWCSSQLSSRRMKWVGTVSINKLRFTDLLRQLIPNDTRLMIKDSTAQTFFFFKSVTCSQVCQRNSS